MKNFIRWCWFIFSDVGIIYPSYSEKCKAVNSQMDFFICLFVFIVCLCFYFSLLVFVMNK